MSKEALAVPAPKAVVFGAFRLAPEGLIVRGKAEFGDWEQALQAAVYLEERSPFWKADLLAYAHNRKDWETLIDAVVDAGTFTKRTVDQYRYVSKNVPPEDRVDGLTFSHHEAVASLPSGDKKHFLTKAKRDHLSVAELKQEIRKVRHVKVIRGQASELAKAQEQVQDYAWQAGQACREIAREDAKHAEKRIKEARRLLDDCEHAVKALRKAQGKP